MKIFWVLFLGAGLAMVTGCNKSSNSPAANPSPDAEETHRRADAEEQKPTLFHLVQTGRRHSRQGIAGRSDFRRADRSGPGQTK